MKRQAILVLLFCLTAIAAHYLTPHVMLADKRPVSLDNLIPNHFQEWHMIPEYTVVIDSPERAAAIKNTYSQVLNRTYEDDKGHRIMLSVAYTRDQSDNAGKQAHLPEICYPAQGFNISFRQPIDLETTYGVISATRLVAHAGARIEPITYWITVGEKAGNSNLKRKLKQLEYGFRGLIADGLIFRVSDVETSTNYEQAYRLHDEFINSLFSSLSQEQRMMLGASKNNTSHEIVN